MSQCCLCGFREMANGEEFVKRVKCVSMAVWPTGATLDGSSWLVMLYTWCKFQISLLTAISLTEEYELPSTAALPVDFTDPD